MFYVAAYDITDDRIRNKIAHYLEEYGKRVQYSCFEIYSPYENQIEIITLKIQEWIEKDDRVFFYPISKWAKKNIVYLPKKVKEVLREIKNEFPRAEKYQVKIMLNEEIYYQLTSNKRISRYLIVYDIHNNSIRKELSQILESYGIRVQLSVFEIDSKPILIPHLINELIPYSYYGKINIYPLDYKSQKKTIRIGTPYQKLDFLI
ncbi:CRISPR-associated protein Cas2 [Desulfurobacterium pacificum]|uniref:CRISPR-associated endoribonuclease Cas2 n=1 Tax=Desulfurobacterium pacificum TaxID=240166 RepID=A0ABY1N7G9_9BACT|nr:CRISPR-associated endonuclease Cas2 [Desulfurobacterium pacificum]SMP02529.1 CRISPR-associated protein Cas2 [Desulfurobacterium pacificum]